MQLPNQFTINIRSAFGSEGVQWLAELPKKLRHLSNQWDFKFIHPISHLTFNFVALVEMNSTGQKVILKMAPPNSSIQSEIRWLKHFNGIVPSVILSDSKENAFLMEECKPGISLKKSIESGDDETATITICTAIKKLLDCKCTDSSFKPLSEQIPDLMALKGILDRATLSKATGLFRELTQNRSDDVLLHGDLHHDNIISHGSSFKIIDPHGYMGDPASEFGVMIYNPIEYLTKNCKTLIELLEPRFKIAEEYLSFDKKRIRAWAFCKTILSAAWNAQDFRDLCELQLELAKEIDKGI